MGHQVRLVDVPARPWAELQRHESDLLRECTLIALDESGPSRHMPVRLVLVVDEIFRRFAHARNTMRAEIDGAVAEGRERVTVTFEVDDELADDLEHAQLLFDEIDDYCSRDEMLTPCTPADAQRLRRWITAEIARQVRDGADPAPPPEDVAG